MLTCTAVSFAHGNNDGQKGVGLVMLILICSLPAVYAINLQSDNYKELPALVQTIETEIRKPNLQIEAYKLDALNKNISNIKDLLKSESSQKAQFIRVEIASLIKILKEAKNQSKVLKQAGEKVQSTIHYAPFWVILAISLCLGIGTMIGYKRIVVTIGEKIGKTHMTYSQGAASETVAAGTIALSSFFSVPVSTTQVLSSGVAGTMLANDGTQNLQMGTLRSIFLAWVLTFPVTVVLSVVFFFVYRLMFL
jgi:PiT family inorganic phosphate transporter